jgi:hypothetical protein
MRKPIKRELTPKPVNRTHPKIKNDEEPRTTNAILQMNTLLQTRFRDSGPPSFFVFIEVSDHAIKSFLGDARQARKNKRPEEISDEFVNVKIIARQIRQLRENLRMAFV